MAQKIQIKRGLKNDLPTLDIGEMGFCTDTKELFIGSGTGNILIPNKALIDTLEGQVVKTINYITPDESGNVNVTGGSGSGSSIETYKTEVVGEFFIPPANYNAWCPSNLHYDKTRNIFVVLINAADSHVFTVLDQYFCKIDPDTLMAATPVKVTVKNADNTDLVWSTQSSSNNFMVFDDGTYMFLRRHNNRYVRVTSIDGGTTWINQGFINVAGGPNTAPTDPNYTLLDNANIWGIKRLSNGRLIAGFGAQIDIRAKLMYSDDNGINWTFISIGTAYPGGTTSAEPHIIEVAPNKLIALGRKSTEGLTHGTVGGAPDPALISFSTDNGVTWTNYVDSQTILDMNASTATSVVHDGMVELFVASRLYQTTSNQNTGEAGTLYHYTATVENALLDQFTLKGVVTYAHADASVDFHAPCAAVDNKKRMLLMFMDESVYPQGRVNYSFVRGGLGALPYKNYDDVKSPIFGYSGKHIDSLITALRTDLASLQYAVSQIPTGGTGGTGGGTVPPPTGTLLWTNTYNAQNESIKVSESTAFTGKFNTSNTATSYNDLLTDTNNVKYNKLASNWGVGSVVDKANFSIQYKGTLGNQVKAPIAGAIINGTGYGIYEIGTYFGISDSVTAIHEYRFEYWNGTMKAFIDGVDVSSKIRTFTFDSANVNMYTNFTSVLGTIDNTKKYVISGASGNHSKVYDIRFGQWDS